MPTLYASIPNMSISRTIRCLRTLSAKPEAAHLVRSFRFHPPSFHALHAFHALLTRVLGNMTGLRALLLNLETTTPSILSRVSCRLTTFICVTHNDSSQISQFLKTQPTIEELSITCPFRGISGLDPDALPALKRLIVPTWLLYDFALPRLSRLSRLCITRTSIDSFVDLAAIFKIAKPPRSLELVIEMDTTIPMTIQVVSLGLAIVGVVAPFITSLMLDIYQGNIQQGELQGMFTFVLPWFPNLKTLTIISPPPTSSAYSNDEPQTYSVQMLSDRIPILHRGLVSLSGRPVDISILFPEQVEHGQTQDQPNSIPDAPNDRSCHMQLLKAWRQVHFGLERVVFPGNAYAYVDKKQGNDG
ncbi:unnamed protein product [Rhizoctonia solani]|uniref:Uncharacterized protein n=1 Tax=Rhizoctonia solani TaxID=456999 RepID=A0A8H3CAD2_9AGAM|nr:unnamed protein product [Rhizoctonia solani]